MRFPAFSLVAVVVLATAQTQAQAVPERPTFTRDVLPILQQHCQECHRPTGDENFGMIAPMSFMSFKETRPWSKAIARQVAARTMPPWHATTEFAGVFENERTLDESEIETLVRWARTGAARGKPSDAPPVRNFPSTDGWSMGKPDLVVSFEEPFFVPDGAEDLYANVTVHLSKEQHPEDRWIKSMDFRPGSEAVHHIVMFGGETMGLGDSALGKGMIGGQGPGTNATVFPEGYGRLLPAETAITFNMHYHKEAGPGTGVWDDSELGFIFQDKPVQHAVAWMYTGRQDFQIPAESSDSEVIVKASFDRDSIVLALFPHMHLRGKAAKYTAYYPDGTEEVLLDVPNYDFNWQTTYIFKEPKHIPAGTRVEIIFRHDNSKERGEWAGFDSSQNVRYGGATTDEMANAFIDWTLEEPLSQDDE